MKKCPFCAEEIQDEAIKCKHCGEFLNRRPSLFMRQGKAPWYFQTSFIVFALACVGPLALPLLWWKPELSRSWKIGWTVGILLISWLLYKMTLESIQVIEEYYQFLNQL